MLVLVLVSRRGSGDANVNLRLGRRSGRSGRAPVLHADDGGDDDDTDGVLLCPGPGPGPGPSTDPITDPILDPSPGPSPVLGPDAEPAIEPGVSAGPEVGGAGVEDSGKGEAEKQCCGVRPGALRMGGSSAAEGFWMRLWL